jgi:hypothetical protein
MEQHWPQNEDAAWAGRPFAEDKPEKGASEYEAAESDLREVPGFQFPACLKSPEKEDNGSHHEHKQGIQ